MSVEIRYPNLSGTTTQQLQQLKGYLYQLTDQLNLALKAVEQPEAEQMAMKQASPAEKEAQAQSNFNEIKALIIKSADIVNAYSQEIATRLEGVYVAESEFGTYKETTEANLSATAKDMTQLYQNVQEIQGAVDQIQDTLKHAEGYIKSGQLQQGDDGLPVYGVEIGQRNEVDGEEVFNQYARFTADKLSFFDSNGIEVAYISDHMLYITSAHVSGVFVLGGFQSTVRADKSVVKRWIGG